MKRVFLGAVAALAIAGSAQAGFLLDYGSPGPYNSGRTVSGNNIAGGWTVFQPFTVTDAAGWSVTTIGVDGWEVQDPLGLGMRGTILPSNGGVPDEGNPIASAQYQLLPNDGTSNWVDVAFNIILPQGNYFMRWDDANDPDHWSAIFPGASGPGSFSRRESDGALFNAGVTALRIDGTIAPTPGALALLGLAGLAGRRRRRD